MTLPAKVVDINTATFGDHKNQPCGPVQGIFTDNFSTDNATFFTLGSDAEYVGTEMTKSGGGWTTSKLVRVRFFLQRVGSPTGNISAELRANVSEAPNFSTLLASTQSYPVSAIPTTGKNQVVLTFIVPYSVTLGNYFIL